MKSKIMALAAACLMALAASACSPTAAHADTQNHWVNMDNSYQVAGWGGRSSFSSSRSWGSSSRSWGSSSRSSSWGSSSKSYKNNSSSSSYKPSNSSTTTYKSKSTTTSYKPANTKTSTYKSTTTTKNVTTKNGNAKVAKSTPKPKPKLKPYTPKQADSYWKTTRSTRYLRHNSYGQPTHIYHNDGSFNTWMIIGAMWLMNSNNAQAAAQPNYVQQYPAAGPLHDPKNVEAEVATFKADLQRDLEAAVKRAEKAKKGVNAADLNVHNAVEELDSSIGNAQASVNAIDWNSVDKAEIKKQIDAAIADINTLTVKTTKVERMS